MAPSVFQLGATAAQAREVHAVLGRGSASRYFALAQRCVWGLSQSDLVRVDVPAALRKLRWPDSAQPITHLLAAYVLRRAFPERAEMAMAQARTLLMNHPWRFMLPPEREWAGTPVPQVLHQVVRGRVWRVEGRVATHGSSFEVGSVGTLVRTEQGPLVFVNPVLLSADVLAEVRELGPILALAVQGRAHSCFVSASREQFPGARVLLTEGHRVHPASSQLPCDGLLGAANSSLPEEFLELPLRGTEADEVALLHRPTRLLILQDLVSNNLASHTERSFAGKLEYFAFGLVDRIGLLSYHPILWRNLALLQASLSAVLASDYVHVTAAHWPIEPCQGAARDAFEAALSHVVGLSKLQHLSYLAEFFAHQPGFLGDLLRYKRRSHPVEEDA